jgi:hypothetical protein
VSEHRPGSDYGRWSLADTYTKPHTDADANRSAYGDTYRWRHRNPDGYSDTDADTRRGHSDPGADRQPGERFGGLARLQLEP